MADEKFSDDIKKELKGFNETVSKNTKKFGKSMAAVINKMAEVNAPLAAQLSDVRAASKDSFAAALQTKKAAELTARLTEVQSSNLIISNKELGELNEIFKKYGAESFDVKGFSVMQKRLKETSQDLEDLENKYQIELEKRNGIYTLSCDNFCSLINKYANWKPKNDSEWNTDNDLLGISKKAKECLSNIIKDLHNREDANVNFYRDLELPVE